MKLLSFEKMASIEGGGSKETSACYAAQDLYSFASKIRSGLLKFLACALILNLCSSSCRCGGGDAS